jgi:ABC-type transport system involved in multi-copper enzyme maturation permease subunit
VTKRCEAGLIQLKGGREFREVQALMTILPIAERELRVAARSPRTYWSRAMVALASMIMVLFVFNGYETVTRTRVGGGELFAALAYVSIAYSLFAGAALTADCLSSEKREETLGFLFLTDLKGYDVVLGKLVATSLRSIYGLMATFPVLALPLLLGGLRASEFWRVVLVVLNTLWLSLALGLLVSTLYRRQRVTTNLASLCMLLLAISPVGASVAIKAANPAGTCPYDPSVLSPLYSLHAAFESGYRMAALAGPSFWTSLLVQFAGGVLLLVRASWLLPRRWQENTTGSPLLVTPLAWHMDAGKARGRRNGKVLENNPMYWLAARGRGATLGLLGLILLVSAWGIRCLDDHQAFAGVQGAGLLLVALVSRLLVAYLAGERLTEDKQSGALDLILTTPLRVEAIIAGIWQAIWKKLRLPLLCSVVLYWFLIFHGGHVWSNEQELAVRRFTAAGFFILSFADLIALAWTLWARNQLLTQFRVAASERIRRTGKRSGLDCALTEIAPSTEI